MNGANLGLAFSAGMVATVNPCGFAMLPAYLSYYLGLEAPTPGDSTDRPAQEATAAHPISRAIRVSAAVTVGFLVVFAAMGFAWSSLSGLIGRRLPYFTIVVGIGLVVMGIAMLRGYEPVLRVPRIRLSSDRRELSSMFLYGVTYAVASLSCTIPIFIGIVATTLDSTVLAGLSVFLAYGTTAVVARRLGAGDIPRALAGGIDGMVLGLGLGVVLAAVLQFAAPTVIGWYGAPVAINDMATGYLRIAACGLPAMLVMLASTGVLRGL